jgi:glycosyltransferase involved in cell wall biosynthesis
MAQRFAQRGYRILYVESLGLRRPTFNGRDVARIYGRLRKGIRGLTKVRENIWVYSPLVIPAHGDFRVRSLNNAILTIQIRSYMDRLDFRKPMNWTYNPLSIELKGRFNESMLTYHCVDDLSSWPGMPKGVIQKAEEDLVRMADLVFTTNSQLQETRARWNPGNTYYYPNVSDFGHFSKARQAGPTPDDLAKIPRPRIGFIGAVSDIKVDFGLISHVAELKKDWHWVIIGEVGEGQPQTSVDLLKRPNIHLLGFKSYQLLPDYLRGFDVAVLPNRINNYTSSMFPMKFFEYLASGKPVVATDLLGLREYADAYISARTPDDFVQALEKVFCGTVPDMKRCLELAEEHTWERRLDQMENLLRDRWVKKGGSRVSTEERHTSPRG